jgi:hypothetical protein
LELEIRLDKMACIYYTHGSSGVVEYFGGRSYQQYIELDTGVHKYLITFITMPHATITEFRAEPTKVARKANGPSRQQNSKQLREMQRLYDESKSLFNQSALSNSVENMLRARNRPHVNKAVSLGLGSLSEKSRDQPRRFKQLAIFLAIARHLQPAAQDLQLYAQDPSFTKTDEAFLQSLNIQVLRTPSTLDLGEARRVIDRSTLVYSPFLTINAYGLLLASCPVDLLIGDDFNSLLQKWDRHTTEHKEVVQLTKTCISQYQRRAVSGTGFWEEDDRAFPMALYWKKLDRRQKGTAAEDAEMHDLSLKLFKAKL